MGKQWECAMCRDRGEIGVIRVDGSIERKPCPECSERWDNRPRVAPMAQDTGDGLPPTYQADYVRNN